MKARQALQVLHRLNDLQLVERRLGVAQHRETASRSAALCERQDGYLDYVGKRIGAVEAAPRLVMGDYQAESDRFQSALDDRALLGARLARDEAALDQSIRECFGLEQRNKTLKQVMASRQLESQRRDDQRVMREMDDLWSQRRERA
ncbi:hypothetical protein D0B54_04955 [Solimonas sp. K1W22B-7]|uniref:hypothetical protein n=1 Tax=Solimonas sp. K1W22B-7 TaxID=2303331 RepID=UPI000E32EDB0|nr:hypothetical protein [Solimonas sp. K1W22B-7]AXQ28062.1 hypothetical protein D0B54_04955 [Solimonas sp. K1W22B-7]